MSTQPVQLQTSDRIDASGMLAEFQALRDEILLRVELRSKLMSLAITSFAAIIALAANDAFLVEVLLSFPLISLFMSAEWTYHDLRIHAMATYIKQELEPLIPGLNWQHHLDERRRHRKFRLSWMSAGGVFVCGSVFSLVLAVAKRNQLSTNLGIAWVAVFILFDFMAIVATVFVLRVRPVDLGNYKSKC